jgi:hypothetical protein
MVKQQNISVEHNIKPFSIKAAAVLPPQDVRPHRSVQGVTDYSDSRFPRIGNTVVSHNRLSFSINDEHSVIS